MSIPIKRKRGRPRLDEPREIKDFDNSLIQEFKKFPVFYDRQHPQHRNREYTDRIWLRISQNLNVSVNIVKTRMLQLRNRFNLEKRRVEAMKEQRLNTSLTSQWSLYESLSFLSDYVKSRRPYSLPVTCNPKVDSTASSSDAEEDDDDDDDGEDGNGTKTQDNTLNSNQLIINGNILQDKQNSDDLSSSRMAIESGTIQQNIQYPMEGNNKYKAFGQFLASSLIEMNEIQALNLVEKFTTELVKYLKTEERKKSLMKTSQRNNTEGEEENSLSVY